MNPLSTIIASAAALLLPFLAAAADSAADSSPSSDTPATPNEAVIAITQKPLHLNPAITSGIYVSPPGAQIFATLLRVNSKWEISPYLAESWTWFPDRLAMTVKLRPNAIFHDLKPITSADIAFSLLSIQKHHPFNDMLAAIASIETPDPLTAIIKLKHPAPSLPLALSTPFTPIIPKHIYGDGQDITKHSANWKPVGSGPFKFITLTPRNEIILEKFEKFFIPGRPKLNRLIVKITDGDLLNNYFEAGAINVCELYFVAPSAITRMKSSPNLNLESKNTSGIGALNWLEFNLRNPPFNDRRVRQAIAYALDRRKIVDSVAESGASLSTGPIASGTPFYTPAVQTYPYNLQKANELLDQAGYPRKTDGTRFSFTLTMRSFGSTEFNINNHLAEFIAAELREKIGVTVEIKSLRLFKDWTDQVANYNYEATTNNVFNWGDPVIGVHRSYHSANIRKGVMWSNTQGYANPEIDRLLDQAKVEPDFAKRKAIYEQFQKLAADDLPVLWLLQNNVTVVHNKNLVDLPDTIWGNSAPFDTAHWTTTPAQPATP